jgi:hypothetical protein
MAPIVFLLISVGRLHLPANPRKTEAACYPLAVLQTVASAIESSKVRLFAGR